MEEHDYIPILEELSPIGEDELRQHYMKLRQYFLSGKKTTDELNIDVAPVLLAQYLRGENTVNDYPALYDPENNRVTSLHNLLEEMICEIFDADEANAFVQKLPHITSHIEENLLKKDPDIKYDSFVNEVVDVLKQIDVNSLDSELFDNQCDIIKKRLLPRKASVIGFSAFTPFQILNLQFTNQNERNQVFLHTLNKCISGLNEILLLYSDVAGSAESQFDFAGDLLSFEKITEIVPPVASSTLPETRLNRLRQCFHTLSNALKSYSENCATVFTTQKLAKEFALKKILKEATLRITNERPCAKAVSYYKKEIHEFVQIIGALRLAELEISQQYDEELHVPYFEGFDLSYLSDDDLRDFRSIIVLEESLNLMKLPEDLLTLLSNNALVKVLSINRLDEIIVPAGQTDEEETYLELAALAIFRRNACVFQAAADTPSWLNEAFQKGLDASCPVIWNILSPKPGSKAEDIVLLALKTAVESRYFPRIEYDIRSGDGFGSHFDINNNPQPGASFPSYDQVIKTSSGSQTHQYNLTMADFLAVNPDNRIHYEIVPAGYRHENLISLADYLAAPQDALVGKIPFIWIVDEQNILKQAVIPLSWISRFRARLEYWRFFQELGGVSSFHISRAIEDAKFGWEASRKAEIEDLKVQLQAEFDRTRTHDLEEAIGRILNSLLDTDMDITTLLGKSYSISTGSLEKEQVPETQPEQEKEKKQQHEPVIRSEVWVESDQCTSCNDCIEALPSVFKYNSNKQAIVHNPKGGPYAKIVATAEKCPARCIHPGLPQDSNEPGLEKLIKRAGKYN